MTSGGVCYCIYLEGEVEDAIGGKGMTVEQKIACFHSLNVIN